jgi:threonine aldolase
MMPVEIDLGSDTATRPSKGMLEAMAAAPVGDEQLYEDPSVNALLERCAALLGQEEAVFLPSGTMCNQIALLLHCRPGDEVISARNAHVYASEGAGVAVLAGALINPIDTPTGIFDAGQMTAMLRRPRMRAPRSRLVVIEQTANRGGGSVWPLATVTSIAEAAHDHGLSLHMDGARLLNAVVASGVGAPAFGRLCDSVWLDFSKGLGCPVGAVLAGPKAFIAEAWVWKHRLGGALRQAGILAGACLYALDHNVERLAEDHANAAMLARLVADIPGVALEFAKTQTNIVFIDVQGTGQSAFAIAERLREHGVRFSIESAQRLRALTHLDIGRADVVEAAAVLRQVLANPLANPRI